jgi:hypothetical protein
MVSRVPVWKKVSMKASAWLLLSGFALNSYAQTYNGPKDPAMNRSPKSVLCTGIPDYPKGANLDFPADYVGNLQDGFTQSIPAGSDGAFIFMGMSLIGKDRLEGEFIYISNLVSLPEVNGTGSKIAIPATQGKTTCTVKSWYKPQAAPGSSVK